MPRLAPPLPELLKLFSEATRLRILALLEREELSVGELARSLGMAQSRVSNHLRLLRETGLLAERHAGPSTFLRLAPFQNGTESVGRIWDSLKAELPSVHEHGADLMRLEGVLAERERGGAAFFDRVAGEWDKLAGDFETGRGRERAAAHLLPRDLTVADLGCGTGYMAASLLGVCTHLICVDHSEGMLAQARARLERSGVGPQGFEAVEYRRGELDRLPIDDGELDGCVAGMVLHHLPELDSPLEEMRRTLVPGGAAVVLELAPHKETWMRDELGDRHLGLEPADVVTAFERAGFEDIVLEPAHDAYQPRKESGGDALSLPLYIVRGRAPRTT